MKRRMEITIMGYVGTTMRILSFGPSQPQASCWQVKACYALLHVSLSSYLLRPPLPANASGSIGFFKTAKRIYPTCCESLLCKGEDMIMQAGFRPHK